VRVPLHVCEVALYGANGAKITPMLATSSSTLDAALYPASKAIDGSVDWYNNFMHPADDDPSPSLRISYPCASGSTSLFKARNALLTAASLMMPALVPAAGAEMLPLLLRLLRLLMPLSLMPLH
jgi:hypothetical protein